MENNYSNLKIVSNLKSIAIRHMYVTSKELLFHGIVPWNDNLKMFFFFLQMTK